MSDDQITDGVSDYHSVVSFLISFRCGTVVGAVHDEASDPVLVGAGDIASCDDLAGAYATAKLIDKIPGTVFAAGDLAYPDGSDEQFANCYGPTWGRFEDRTRPAPGNHEYHSGGATGYVRYLVLLGVIRRRPGSGTSLR